MFQLISDGSCDLSPEQIRAAKLAVVPFYISLDGKTYQKEAEELPVRDFYKYCIQHPECAPKTSMPSVEDYVRMFRKYLDQGKDILCYCITKRFSGSINGALAAKSLLQDSYPERVIRVADSTLVTGLQGLLLMELSAYAQQGHSLEETFARGEEIKKSAALYFTIEDLSYLARGGRIGKLTDSTIRKFNLHPLISFKEGELHPLGVSIGRENSFDKIAALAGKILQKKEFDLNHYTYGFGWGFEKEEGEPFFQKLRIVFKERFGAVPDFVPIQVGATIGVHTGPNPVGFGFIEKA